MSKLAEKYIKNNGLEAFKKLCYYNTVNFKYNCVLDSCSLNTGVTSSKYELLAAFGAERLVQSIMELEKTYKQDWIFGALNYDLKNNFESLRSENLELFDTGNVSFFVPEIVIAVYKDGEVRVLKGSISNSFIKTKEIKTRSILTSKSTPNCKESYVDKIKQIHNLIREGDVYELNYCLAFKRSFESFNPVKFQLDLLAKSAVPMANYFTYNQYFMCGASMERFLVKKQNTLISQPIKGTIGKGKTLEEDKLLIQELENSEKDRAENVMIVDLVRNDLAKVCKPGTIKVEELFGIYSYLQVHQMISTVSGELKPNITFGDILRATYPMGSMTGAPKIAAMKFIEELEDFKRGWYSGSVGYIEPNGDFDFNVVIRSLLGNMNTKEIAYCAGGAITIDSETDKEWNEIKLKTKAITSILAD